MINAISKLLIAWLQVDSTISSPPRLEVPKLPKGKKLLDVVAQKDLETLQR